MRLTKSEIIDFASNLTERDSDDDTSNSDDLPLALPEDQTLQVIIPTESSFPTAGTKARGARHTGDWSGRNQSQRIY
jgi:hypothetical protein